MVFLLCAFAALCLNLGISSIELRIDREKRFLLYFPLISRISWWERLSRMNIIIGSDHAGYDLKEECKSHLLQSGEHRVTDVGVFSRDSSDYPRIAKEVAGAVGRGEHDRGVLVCGSGIGMSITANRFKRVRAALCHDVYSAKMSRLHNDANVLAMGGRIVGPGVALEILEVFLKTEFEGGRHKKRLDLIDD
jgi:ribose 5-phosphate isomerase B